MSLIVSEPYISGTTIGIESLSTSSLAFPYNELESTLSSIEYKKGGRGGGSGGGKGGGSSGGKGEGSNGGKGEGSNGGRHYYYNGVDYRYGYPVAYAGNAFYPRGVILPVAFGGGAGYLIGGHVYHTYNSSSTLYYSEMPTTCSGSSLSTLYSSSSAIETCIPQGSSYSFTDGGGIVTIQNQKLASVSYSTLSDVSTASGGTESSTQLSESTTLSESSTASSSSTIPTTLFSTSITSSASTTMASVSSISTASANGSGSLYKYNNYPFEHQKLIYLVSFIMVITSLVSLI